MVLGCCNTHTHTHTHLSYEALQVLPVSAHSCSQTSLREYEEEQVITERSGSSMTSLERAGGGEDDEIQEALTSELDTGRYNIRLRGPYWLTLGVIVNVSTSWPSPTGL